MHIFMLKQVVASASHNVATGWKEQNIELGTHIIDSKKETIINMRNR